MRIAIEMALTAGGKRGGDVYADNLVRGLASVDPLNEYFLFGYAFKDHARRESSIPCPDRPNIRRLIKRWPQGLVDRLEWGMELPVIEMYMRREGMDLYHCAGPRLPHLSRVRSVATFHDLIPFAHPEFMPAAAVAHWQACERHAAATATRLIASSTATKRDLMEHLGVPESKISMILLGVDREIFHGILDMEALAGARRRYAVPDHFLISAGPFEPRRNWEAILRAASILRSRGRDLGVVLTGGVVETAAGKLKSLAAELKVPLVLTGYVPIKDLALLYNLAEAFVYPSFYDGFNLPLIEAMACGLPAVVTAVGALPEIAGGAASLAASPEAESVAEALAPVLTP